MNILGITTRSLAFLAVLQVSYPTARADIIFDVGLAGNPGSSLAIASGGQITIDIFLAESGAGENRLRSLGLSSAVFNILPTDFSFVGTSVTDAVTVSSPFSARSAAINGGNVELDIFSESGGNLAPVFPAAGTNYVLLGQAHLIAPVIASGQHKFEIQSGLGNGLDVLLGDNPFTGASLSPAARQFSVSVTAVPEPTSLYLVGLAASVCAWRRRSWS